MQSLNVFHAAISRRYNNNNLNKTVECKGKGIECGWRRGGGRGAEGCVMCRVSQALSARGLGKERDFMFACPALLDALNIVCGKRSALCLHVSRLMADAI